MTKITKALLTGVILLVPLAFAVGMLEGRREQARRDEIQRMVQAQKDEIQQREQARKDDLQCVKEVAVRMREDFCAQHIGELKGSKHEAALKWWKSQSFAVEGNEHRMTDEDLRTCREF
jgi:hypothetical protein